MAPLYIALVIAMVVVHVEGQCTSSFCSPFDEDGQCNHWSSKQWDMVNKILIHVEVQQTAMETLKADLDAQKAALDTQKADLDSQKAALDTQKADMDTQKADMDTLKAALGTQKADLDTQKAALDSLKADMDTQKAALDAQEEKQEALQEVLQTVLKGMQGHQSAIEKLNSSVTNVTEKVDGQEQSLELFEMEQQRLQSEKNALERQVSNINNAMSNLQTSSRNSIQQLDRQVSNINNAMSNLQTSSRNSIQQLESQVSNINNVISGLGSTRTQLQNIQGDICGSSFRKALGFVDIRLVNGGSNYGRLEVKHGDDWGTVCDDDFDNNDAMAFCRSLGLSWQNAFARIDAYYGQGTGPIWLDDLSCPSSACSVALCGHIGWGVNNCGHHEDVGIYCQ